LAIIAQPLAQATAQAGGENHFVAELTRVTLSEWAKLR
jgi:hypothetical protein